MQIGCANYACCTNSVLDRNVSRAFNDCGQIYDYERQLSLNFQRRRVPTWISAWKSLLDSTTFCYALISTFMLSVGVAVLFVTTKDKSIEKISENNMGSNAQLWIIGPIFLAAGLLICVKGTMHLYKDRRSEQDGRLSALLIERQNAIMPPSYSNALLLSTPCHLFEGYKTADASMSLDNCDIEPVEVPPPTYAEALKVINCSDLTNTDDNRPAVHSKRKQEIMSNSIEFII